MRPDAAQHQNEDERGERHRDGGGAHAAGGGPQRSKLWKEFGRLLREVETEQLLDLARPE